MDKQEMVQGRISYIARESGEIMPSNANKKIEGGRRERERGEKQKREALLNQEFIQEGSRATKLKILYLVNQGKALQTLIDTTME
eukprot:scaffold37796_cov113-Skeletonema_marinoi.AAC.8